MWSDRQRADIRPYGSGGWLTRHRQDPHVFRMECGFRGQPDLMVGTEDIPARGSNWHTIGSR